MNNIAIIPNGSDIFFKLNAQSRDIAGDVIAQERRYYVLALSVADGLLTDMNALSVRSNHVVLAIPDYPYAGFFVRNIRISHAGQ